jgi:hypothetical protein
MRTRFRRVALAFTAVAVGAIGGGVSAIASPPRHLPDVGPEPVLELTESPT